MLKQRILTAVVLLAVLALALTVAAPWGFPALAALFLVVASWEWMRLVGVVGRGPLWLAALVALCLGVFAWAWPLPPWPRLAVLTAAAVFWAVMAVRLVATQHFFPIARHRLLHILVGLLLGPACWIGIVAAYDEGMVFLVSVLALVWTADIAAYFTGRAFGRNKLAPSISPNKTWEGVAGGVLAVWMVAAVCILVPGLEDTLYARLADALPMFVVTLLLTLLTGMSIVGDLFESHLKRDAGVKDSSALLPGHGGVLDRIDALLPVVPIAVLMLAWI